MKKLVIVQNKPTQFDVPLYFLAYTKNYFDLHVFYSDAYEDPVDPEIDRVPLWDHLIHCSYPQTILTSGQASNPVTVCGLILEQQPDLVILCGYSPVLHAKLVWLLKRKNIRIGLRSDNTVSHSNFCGIKGFIKKMVLPFWLSQYDTWHPVGTLAEQYFHRISKHPKPVYFFPYSVDNLWFEGQSQSYRVDRDKIREQLGFHRNDFIVLGIMKWNDREDPLTLIKAVKQINQSGQAVKLILVGDGPLRDEVKKAASFIMDSIFMPGYLPYSQLPKYYAVSDQLVHPAINEPWGVSVNEAMACGIPVIAAQGVGSGRDLIIQGETGYTYPNRDSAALAGIILKLYHARDNVYLMGKAAKKQVQKWGYDLTIKEMVKALEG